MTIEALQGYITKQESMIDEVFDLINVYTESAISEYELNLKRVEYKVIKENGTEEDEEKLNGQASEGLVGKLRNGVIKLIEAIKKFCMNIYTKITEKINDAKTAAAIKKAEKLAAKNKKLNDQKITVEDTDKKIGIIDKNIDKLKAIGSKIDAGKEVAGEEIDNIMSNHKKEIAATAAITVTLAAGIALLYKNKDV